MNPHTFIVLASFNGADFLIEQLKSLHEQTEIQWKLLIRDDGSTDGSIEIIRDCVAEDNQIELLENEDGVGCSARANFSSLLAAAYKQGAEYIFCCDQDDVWEPNKLELMLAELKQLEGKDKAPAYFTTIWPS